MKHSDTEIVSTLRAMLVERLGQDRFDLWLSSCQFACHSHTLTLITKNAFSAEFVRKHFSPFIQETIVEVLGPQATWSIQVGSNEGQPSAEGAESTKQATSSSGADTASSESAQKLDDANQKTAPQQRTLFPSEDANQKPAKTGRRFARLDAVVVGDCNRVAVTSAQEIVKNLGSVSPFMVYGPTGVGKTHLLEGIWGAVRQQSRRRRVIYLSAEQFTTYFLQALKGSGLPSFRQKYRALDLFVLDDLQFLSGKHATVVELIHTVDSILRDGGQVVLSADRAPMEMSFLGDEIVTRLSGGLACQMKELDLATMETLVQRMSQRRSLTLSESVIRLIAETLPGDARQVAGTINRIWAHCQAFGSSPTETVVQDILGELTPRRATGLRLMDIERAICSEFAMDAELLRSNRRTRDVSHPRMLAMWLARRHTRAGLAEISEFFGRRSHSTVLSAQNKVDEWVQSGNMLQMATQTLSIREILQRLEAKLKQG
ncbi:MAG: DnaA/Hda family protein [Pirellulaceae bacterium]